MAPPPRMIVPFLTTFLLYPWQCHRVDPEQRRLNGKVGQATVVTINAFRDRLYRAYRVRAGRVSWGMVRFSIASFSGAYYLLRRLALCEAG
jgi:hypothetical protein